MSKWQVGMVRVIVGDSICTLSMLKIYPVEVNHWVNWSTYTTAEKEGNVGKDTYDEFLA